MRGAGALLACVTHNGIQLVDARWAQSTPGWCLFEPALDFTTTEIYHLRMQRLRSKVALLPSWWIWIRDSLAFRLTAMRPALFSLFPN